MSSPVRVGSTYSPSGELTSDTRTRTLHAGIHGFVTRSIRGYDTRALKQRIVGVVASVLGGALLGPHFARIVRGGSGDDDDKECEQEDAARALEDLLLALRVIDQFGVLTVWCLPHDSLMFVRRNCAPAAVRLLDETFNRGAHSLLFVASQAPTVTDPIAQLLTTRLSCSSA